MWLPHRLALLAVTTLALAGCRRSVPSTQYQTPDVQGDFRVDAWSPEETTVWAFLRPAGEQEEAGLFLTMGKGDELWAEAGGRRLRLETHPEDQAWTYRGTFRDPVPDGAVRIAFERRDGASAPESIADLPDPFELDPIPAEVSRASALEMRWTPAAADPLEITVAGDCMEEAAFQVKDDRGRYTLPANAIKPVEGAQKDCDADLIVRRTRPGHPDPGLHDGSTLLASQARKVRFRSVP
jgi:hypothetical protein